MPACKLMKIKSSIDEVLQSTSKTISFECEQCCKIFARSRHDAFRALKRLRSPINYCSQKCRINEVLQRSNTETCCANCTKQITVLNSTLGERNFCSRSCSTTFNNFRRRQKPHIEHVIRPVMTTYKFCIRCNTQFNKIKYRPMHCSLQCYREGVAEEYLTLWKSGAISGSTKTSCSKTIRNHLLKLSQNKCSICQWSKVNPATGKVPLEIDHVDGDHTNNSCANLRVVCPNCHSLTPNYRALNKGNGRTHRRQSG